MFTYKELEESKINVVKNLWNKNRIFHQKNTVYFSTDYANLNFEDRMKKLLSRSKLSKITVVENKDKQVIAYCMSIIDKAGSGEIATLYVEEEYRRMNIGKHLLQLHIEWLQDSNVVNIEVEVLHDNLSAIKLYENIGFRKDTMKMRIPTNQLI